MTIAPDITRRVARIMRFDRVQRSAHWLTAALFGVLMFTAIPLYFGSFFGVVFPRHLMEMIHLWTGLALPIPVIASVLGPWGRGMRRDLRRVNAWTRREIRWLLSRGRTPLEADKFNPGQKAQHHLHRRVNPRDADHRLDVAVVPILLGAPTPGRHVRS